MTWDPEPPLRLAVPAYDYPWPASRFWPRLRRLAPGSVVVIDPADGPGSELDPRYVDAVAELRRAGARVLGYVDSAYGVRDHAAMLDDARAHQRWYDVDGVFIDRAWLHTDAYDDEHVALLRSLREMGLPADLNAGQPHVDPRFLELADRTVLFEGPFAQYLGLEWPGWTSTVDPARQWHLVYDVPTAQDMATVAALARARGAGWVTITDRGMPNPWDGVPTYWDDLVDSVGGRQQT